MTAADIRWQQRFSQYQKSYILLKEATEILNPSKTERAGVIQFFETTFELAWKLLKDFEEIEGQIARSPREAIKLALQLGIITNGHDWLEALSDRNLTVHTYDEQLADEIDRKIKSKYFSFLTELHDSFLKKVKS